MPSSNGESSSYLLPTNDRVAAAESATRAVPPHDGQQQEPQQQYPSQQPQLQPQLQTQPQQRIAKNADEDEDEEKEKDVSVQYYLSVLKEPTKHPIQVQRDACQALSKQLSPLKNRNRNRKNKKNDQHQHQQQYMIAQNGNGISILLDAMKWQSHDVEFQTSALEILANLASSRPPAQPTQPTHPPVQPPVQPPVMKIKLKDEDDEDDDDDDNDDCKQQRERERALTLLLRKGGLDGILTAMKVHWQVPMIQATGCRACANVFAGTSLTIKAKMGGAACIKTILKAMRMFPIMDAADADVDDADADADADVGSDNNNNNYYYCLQIQLHGCCALRNLSRIHHDAVAGAGGMGTIVIAMRESLETTTTTTTSTTSPTTTTTTSPTSTSTTTVQNKINNVSSTTSTSRDRQQYQHQQQRQQKHHHKVLQEQACAALYNLLVRGTIDNVLSLASEGGISLLVQVLREYPCTSCPHPPPYPYPYPYPYPDHAPIQRQGLGVLARMSTPKANNQESIVAAKGLDVVLAALNNINSSNSSNSIGNSNSNSNSTTTMKTANSKNTTAKKVNTAVTAAAAEISKHGCEILQNLTLTDQDFQRAVVAKDGVRILLTTMRRQEKNVAVQLFGGCALRNLCRNPDNLRQVAGEGGIPTLLKTMTIDPKNNSYNNNSNNNNNKHAMMIQSYYYACDALSLLATQRNHQIVILSKNGIATVMEAMTTAHHHSEPSSSRGIQERGCIFLDNMSTCQEAVVWMKNFGAIAVIQAAVSQLPRNSKSRTIATALVKRLQTSRVFMSKNNSRSSSNNNNSWR